MTTEKTKKPYGKLTLPQFQRVVKALPEVRQQMNQLPQLIRSAPRSKVEEVLDKDFYWSEVYELPFVHQLGLLFYALGRVKRLLEISKSPDPQEAALDW